jgi:hypothetical protein
MDLRSRNDCVARWLQRSWIALAKEATLLAVNFSDWNVTLTIAVNLLDLAKVGLLLLLITSQLAAIGSFVINFRNNKVK